MADEQRQMLQQRQLDGDETEAQRREINNGRGIRRNRLARRLAESNEEREEQKARRKQKREKSIRDRCRHSPRTLGRKVEWRVVKHRPYTARRCCFVVCKRDSSAKQALIRIRRHCVGDNHAPRHLLPTRRHFGGLSRGERRLL